MWHVFLERNAFFLLKLKKTSKKFCQFSEKYYLCSRNSAEVHQKRLEKGPGGGMVDALVSGASGESRAGSSPVLGTAF